MSTPRPVVSESDANRLAAVGLYPGAALPHPLSCSCSEHPKPCPHDVVHTWGKDLGYKRRCARCHATLEEPEAAPKPRGRRKRKAKAT